MVVIRNAALRAEVSPFRAELVSLRTSDGHELMWDGNPDVWKGSSPILFPIVGMVPNDEVKIDGQSYRLQQHGLAPRAEFVVAQIEPNCCAFRFEASPETSVSYPFDFCLDVTYSLIDDSLIMSAVVSNRSEAVMPFSFGFHPGFVWPLPEAGARSAHSVEFEKEELGGMRRPLDGLLHPQIFESAISDRRIGLKDSLFDDGAMMFFDLASQRLRYGSDQGISLDIQWHNLPHLALWTKPGAGYLCVEPWQGFSAPVGFTGELAEKPGIVNLPPSDQREFKMVVTVRNSKADGNQ